MKRTKRRGHSSAPLIIIAILVITAAAIFFVRREKEEEVSVNPHEGQVFINDGFDWIWMTPLEGVDKSRFTDLDFTLKDGYPEYIGSDYEVLTGIDVSEHQHEVDWNQVAGFGIDYAYIRLGYRGYTEGGLFTDPFYETNMTGAKAVGLKTGVYFFSQAISAEEAAEEAQFVIDGLSGFNVDLPVVYDWEKIEGGGARTDSLDNAVLTDCAIAFCEKIKEAGYTPCIYFNRYLGYYKYELERINDYMFWVSVPGEFPEFYYQADMWQYSFEAQVPGTIIPTDLNMYFIPIYPEVTEEPSVDK